jgi:hypothetical protein
MGFGSYALYSECRTANKCGSCSCENPAPVQAVAEGAKAPAKASNSSEHDLVTLTTWLFRVRVPFWQHVLHSALSCAPNARACAACRLRHPPYTRHIPIFILLLSRASFLAPVKAAAVARLLDAAPLTTAIMMTRRGQSASMSHSRQQYHCVGYLEPQTLSAPSFLPLASFEVPHNRCFMK